jgi:hypothetical protein
MQFPSFIRPALFSVAALALVGAAGCATEAPARAPQTAMRSVGRGDAIAEAQQDAAQRFGERAAGVQQAMRVGGLWIVELHRQSGGTLRYAISTQDGSIRERNMFQ